MRKLSKPDLKLSNLDKRKYVKEIVYLLLLKILDLKNKLGFPVDLKTTLRTLCTQEKQICELISSFLICSSSHIFIDGDKP